MRISNHRSFYSNAQVLDLLAATVTTKSTIIQLALLGRMGVGADRVGDSTGILKNI